ncbi:MAG: small multi-drug export protein [Nitriliruptoraceae bacterium]
MNLEQLGLFGVFLGGAIPWLEAVTVIPAGLLFGLPPIAVVVLAVVGNLITVAIATYFGAEIRRRVQLRRQQRGETHVSKRDGRAVNVARRFGLPGLAILGPLGIGTQLAAIAAIGLGFSAKRTFVWIGAATIGWSAVITVLTIQGMGLAGLNV